MREGKERLMVEMRGTNLTVIEERQVSNCRKRRLKNLTGNVKVIED